MSSRKKQKTNVFGSLIVGFLVVLVVFLYFTNTKAKASWFDDAWRYRVAIPISAHTSAETNVYITLSGADGINTTDTTKFQADCGDIRFVNEAGDLLPYYLTTACGLSQTGFQVYFESFPAGAQTIYYYYGNPSAPNGYNSASMGAAATGVTLGTRGSETTAPSSPMVYLRLDEGTGQTVSNSMETVNNGTMGPDATVTATDPSWRGEELCVSGKCLEFESSSSQYVNIANSIAGVKSVSFWVKPTSTTTSLLVLNGPTGNASLSVSSGTISAGPGFTSPTIYVNGKVSSTIAANQWQYVTVTTSTGITASNMVLGRVNTSYLDGFMDEIKLFGSVIDASQIKSGYTNILSRSSGIKNNAVNFGGGMAAGNLTDGLVGYWKMDETATPAVDSSGNGNNGTWTNSPTSIAGKYGNGVYFDTATTNKYITVSAAASINNPSSFTYSTWINPSQLQSSKRFIGKGGIVALSLQNISSSTRVYFDISCSGADMQVQTTSANILTLNSWNHVVATWDGKSCDISSANIYINGVLAEKHASSTSGTGNKDDDSVGPLTLGNNWASYSTQLQGSMDETRMYNRALSSAEVSQLYNWAPGPVAYWKLDENLGTQAKDSSGNSYTGTLTSSPAWAIGKIGSSVNFDGVNDYIDIGDVFYSDVLTIGFWVKLKSVDATNGKSIVLKRNGSGISASNNEFVVQVNSTRKIEWATWNSGGSGITNTVSNTALNLNQWYRVDVVNGGSGSTAKIYINGVLDVTSSALGSTIGNTSSVLQFGTRQASNNNTYFDGYLDDVKIYNYSRTQSQIIEDMNAGSAALSGVTGSSLLHLKFDEGYGDTANDSSAQSNDGNMSGSTTCPSVSICPTWSTAGVVGKAMYFGGLQTGDGDSHIRLENDRYDTNSEGSISFWFKPDPAWTNNDIFGAGEDDNGGGSDFVGILYDATEEALSIGASNNGTLVLNALTPVISNPTEWHHAVWTVGQNGNEVYVDGEKQTLSYLTGNQSVNTWFDDISENTTAYTIGCTDFDGSDTNDCNGVDFFRGYLDEFKIFASPLTAEQVKIEYNSGLQTKLGAISTNSTGIASNSSTDSYCPPGQGSTCTGPVGHWKLDENTGSSAYDISGNNATGTISGADWVPGKKGSALDFVLDDDVDAGDADRYSITTTGALSGMAWVYLRGDSGGYPISKYQTTGSNQEWSLRLNADETPRAFVDDNAGGTYMSAQYTTPISKNRWYHLAFTIDTGTNLMRLYLDGNLVVESNSTAGTIAPNRAASFRIGENANNAGDWDGYIDDVRIYNYARTPEQIAWDMNQGAPAGLWKFDECQGATLYDSANFENTAAITIGASGTQSTVGTCAVNATTARYTGREGKINSALNFDGTDDYAVRTGTALPTGDLSVSAWVYRNATNNSHTIVKASPGNGTNELKFAIMSDDDGSNPNKLRFTVDGTSTYSQTALPSASTWYHVVGVRSGSTVRMYINGKLDPVSGSDGTALSFGSCNLYIGGSPSSGCSASLIEYFNGKIDDLRIYNYALNATQVKQIMNDGAVKLAPVTGSPN